MIVYPWDAPPWGGVSGSLERAQEAAGAVLAGGHAQSARIEAAQLSLSAAALEDAYERTGQAWAGRRDSRGAVTWIPAGGDGR